MRVDVRVKLITVAGTFMLLTVATAHYDYMATKTLTAGSQEPATRVYVGTEDTPVRVISRPTGGRLVDSRTGRTHSFEQLRGRWTIIAFAELTSGGGDPSNVLESAAKLLNPNQYEINSNLDTTLGNLMAWTKQYGFNVWLVRLDHALPPNTSGDMESDLPNQVRHYDRIFNAAQQYDPNPYLYSPYFRPVYIWVRDQFFLPQCRQMLADKSVKHCPMAVNDPRSGSFDIGSIQSPFFAIVDPNGNLVSLTSNVSAWQVYNEAMRVRHVPMSKWAKPVLMPDSAISNAEYRSRGFLKIAANDPCRTYFRPPVGHDDNRGGMSSNVTNVFSCTKR